MSIKIGKLLSITVQLAREACFIVQESYMNKNLKKYLKEADDHVTEADFKVQTMLIQGIREHYPDIKIIGEEETQYKGQISVNYKEIKEQFFPKQINFEKEYPQDELCLWIDPIDCTSGFVNEHVQDVTVLIGISHNKKAQVGVVGIPFKKINEGEPVFQPSIMFGSASQKKVYEYFPNKEKGHYKEVKKIKQNEKKQMPRVTVSTTRGSMREKGFIEELKGELVDAGGSGRKIMMVVKDEAEMMIYLKSFTYKWDSCAGEAIVKGLGGYMRTPFGEELAYDPEKFNEPNKDGFFCTFNENLYEATIQLCQKAKKDMIA